MPLSIEVCLCILLCAASTFLLMLAMYFIERTFWYQDFRYSKTTGRIENKKNSARSERANGKQGTTTNQEVGP